MAAADVAGLAELAVPGRQPGEEVDQVPERHRAEPGPRPHQKGEQEHPAPARPQPRRRPRHGRAARRTAVIAAPSRRRGRAEPGVLARPLNGWPRGAAPAPRRRARPPATAVRNLARGVRERPQRLRDSPLRGRRQPAQDLRDQRAAPAGGLVDHLPARRGDRHQDHPAVAARPVPADQALAHQPVAHPPGGRRRHVQRLGQVHDPPRPAGRQHHQRPVLRDRGLLRGRAQRPGGDRDHGPAGGQHRVHRRRVCVRFSLPRDYP